MLPIRFPAGMHPAAAAALCWFLLACLAAPATAAAAAAAPAAPAVAWFEDGSAELSIEAVAGGGATAVRFAAASGNPLNFGLSRSAYWVRIVVPRGTDAELLEVATPYLDVLDFYRPRPEGGFERVEAGDHRPFGSREMDYRHPLFRLAGATHADAAHYLRVRNAGAIQLPLHFWSTDAFRRAAMQEAYLFGLFYGLLLVMTLYNLFLFVGVRDRAYLWYVIYVALFGLFMLARNGFAFQWLWPDSPWLGNNAHYLLIAGAIAAAVQFTRRFLDTPVRTPRLDPALRLAAAFGAVVALAALAGWQRSAVLGVQAHSLVAVGLGVAAATHVARAGYAPARYYLIAFATVMAASVFSVARNLGLFPANALSTYGVQIGSAAEIVLLALGLADRINTLKRDKAAAQTAALRSQEALVATLRRSGEELERRVRERTEELAHANERLRQREQALEKLAHRDALTGLANRALLEDRLEQALSRARRRQSLAAVLLVDLDGFKAINDRHGHDSGDAVLRAVAGRLRRSVREGDTVARLGGDEFIVLLEELQAAEDCDAVAGKLLQSIGEAVPHDGIEMRVTPSIGAAVFPADAAEAPALLRRADAAMYEAKRAGRNAYRRAG